MCRPAVATVCLFLLGWGAARGEVPADPAAASYDMKLRFRISGGVQTRYPIYQAMVSRLKAAGLEVAPGRPGEEIFGNRLEGVLPGSGLAALRAEPAVRVALLVPTGLDLASEGDKPLLVRLELSTAFGVARQKELADLARAALAKLGFVESVGHDHRYFTRLLGRLPASALPALLAENQEVEVPASLAGGTAKTTPIRLAVVLPEPNGAAEAAAAAPPAPQRITWADKIAPELMTLAVEVPEDQAANKLFQVEVVLRNDDPPSWRDLLQNQAGMQLEGKLGPVVTGLLPAKSLPALAALEEVSGIRLPTLARPYQLPPFVTVEADQLPLDFVPLDRLSDVKTLPAQARRTTPAKAVVIASDFSGYAQFLGKGLPSSTQLIDCTAELRANLEPLPASSGGVGQGTRLALAFQQATGAEQLLLVRIDPACAYQVEQVGRAVAGLGWNADALRRRWEELRLDRAKLDSERTNLRVLRSVLLDNFGIDESAQASRKEFAEKEAAYQSAMKAFQGREQRYLRFQRGIQQLKGATQVLLGLVWVDGQGDRPDSPPSLRHLSPEVLRAASWVQALPRRTGQIWTDRFVDLDQDNAMEFVAVDHPRAAAAATSNFLAWKAFGQENTLPLPAGALIQASITWTETHDPSYAQLGADVYRQPLGQLRIVILKQRDPTGKKLPVDAFDVVARSPRLAERVDNVGRQATYVTTARFQVPDGGGRYAVRVEGAAPQGTAPPGSAQVTRERGELRPKLVVDVLNAEHRQQGRPILSIARSDE